MEKSGPVASGSAERMRTGERRGTTSTRGKNVQDSSVAPGHAPPVASIHREIILAAHPDAVWDALRDFGAVHKRLVPGFVVDARLDGPDRVVTFFTGAVARERLVARDDEQRRLAWSVTDSPIGLTHHSASAQVFPVGGGRTRFVWIADLLPDEAAERVSTLMERGMDAIRQALDGGS